MARRAGGCPRPLAACLLLLACAYCLPGALSQQTATTFSALKEAVISSEQQFLAALRDSTVGAILVNCSQPLVLTQEFWASVKEPIPVARPLRIEPHPSCPPLPPFDFGYVSGKALIDGCAAFRFGSPNVDVGNSTTAPPTPNATGPNGSSGTPTSNTTPGPTSGPDTMPPANSTMPDSSSSNSSDSSNTALPSGVDPTEVESHVPMVTIRGFELLRIQVRVSFGFFISREGCELRVEDSINHLEVAMPRSFGERYFATQPRPPRYAASGWAQLFSYVPQYCYPSNRTRCYSPANVFFDVALVDPLTDDNGGYLLHYMDTVAHGDVNLDEECVKVMSVPDCVQRAIAALHGLPTPDAGATAAPVAGGVNASTSSQQSFVPQAEGATQQQQQHHERKSVKSLAWIIPLCWPVAILAILAARWWYLRRKDRARQQQYDSNDDPATALYDAAADPSGSGAGNSRGTERFPGFLSYLGSLASTVWGSASGASAAARRRGVGIGGGSRGISGGGGGAPSGFVAFLSRNGISLGRLIGSGSYGKVFEGLWRGRLVAVKVMAHSRTEAEQVAREVTLACGLSHPNVLATYTHTTIANAATTNSNTNTSSASASAPSSCTKAGVSSTPASSAAPTPAPGPTPAPSKSASSRSPRSSAAVPSPFNITASSASASTDATKTNSSPADSSGDGSPAEPGTKPANAAATRLWRNLFPTAATRAAAPTIAPAAAASAPAAAAAVATELQQIAVVPNTQELPAAPPTTHSAAGAAALTPTPSLKLRLPRSPAPSSLVVPVPPGTRPGTPRPPISSSQNAAFDPAALLSSRLTPTRAESLTPGAADVSTAAAAARRALFSFPSPFEQAPAPESAALPCEAATQTDTPRTAVTPEPAARSGPTAADTKTPAAAATTTAGTATTCAGGEVETWVVSELCVGGSVADGIARGDFRDSTSGELRVPALLCVARDIARGMAYLHAKGVVHGDLKTDNVLLAARDTTAITQTTSATPATAATGRTPARSLPWSTPAASSSGANLSGSNVPAYQYTAKVCDFGLSRHLSPGATCVMTAGGKGSVSHMAPELLRRGEVRREGDVYAFGVLLWELCTGLRAFRGLSHGEVVQAVVLRGARPADHAAAAADAYDAPPEAAEAAAAAAAVPDELQELISSCWCQEVVERPSFEEVLYRLDCLGMCCVAVVNPQLEAQPLLLATKTAEALQEQQQQQQGDVEAGLPTSPMPASAADAVLASGAANATSGSHSAVSTSAGVSGGAPPPPGSGLAALMSHMARLGRRSAAKKDAAGGLPLPPNPVIVSMQNAHQQQQQRPGAANPALLAARAAAEAAEAAAAASAGSNAAAYSGPEVLPYFAAAAGQEPQEDDHVAEKEQQQQEEQAAPAPAPLPAQLHTPFFFVEEPPSPMAVTAVSHTGFTSSNTVYATPAPASRSASASASATRGQPSPAGSVLREWSSGLEELDARARAWTAAAAAGGGGGGGTAVGAAIEAESDGAELGQDYQVYYGEEEEQQEQEVGMGLHRASFAHLLAAAEAAGVWQPEGGLQAVHEEGEEGEGREQQLAFVCDAV